MATVTADIPKHPSGAAPARLNATAGALLGLLHDGPMSGWDLAQSAQRRIGEFWTITQSQVYRELATMAKRGLVDQGPPGRRERKPYRITDEGRDVFADWIARAPGPDQVRMPLLLTLAFAHHLPAERLYELIEAGRAVHAERLARYLAERQEFARAPEAGPTRAATLEFGIRYEQAVLDWFSALPTLLAGEDAE